MMVASYETCHPRVESKKVQVDTWRDRSSRKAPFSIPLLCFEQFRREKEIIPAVGGYTADGVAESGPSAGEDLTRV